jgi:hypothetical protein
MVNSKQVTLGLTALLFVIVHASVLRPQNADVAPDSGEVTGNRYTSNYFHFTYVFPTKWVVQRGDVRKQLSDSGEKILKDPRNLEAAQKGRTESYNLLMLTSDDQPPAIITVMTEDVNLSPKIESARDYLTRLTRMFVREGTPVIEPISDFERGGQQFAAMNVRMDVHGVAVYQRLEDTLCRGYVLTFGIASQSRQNLGNAVKSLDSLKFAGCK